MRNTGPVIPLLDTDIRLGHSGRHVIALTGTDKGRYPHGTSLLVSGTEETVLIDPSLSVSQRGGVPAERVDRMLVSHAHEDHMAGCHHFPDAALLSHTEDVDALRSLRSFLDVYGMDSNVEETWAEQLVRDFNYVARDDASGFVDGQTFDVGGGLRIEVIHLPGHSRGHSAFLVEPEGVLYVADIDLTAFGPYYGDHWSDLEDFERSLERVQEIEARWYVTFHHKGIVEGQQEFRKQVQTFRSVIDTREARLVEFLREPHTLDEIVAHRFIYRPGDVVLWADTVERRSMSMHLDRLIRTGAVMEEVSMPSTTFRST
jgi:hydroxyacylglutathione hydrolase